MWLMSGAYNTEVERGGREGEGDRYRTEEHEGRREGEEAIDGGSGGRTSEEALSAALRLRERDGPLALGLGSV